MSDLANTLNCRAALPASVRYVKNGAGGRWWPAAKASGQVHAGWKDVPDQLIKAADLKAIEPIITKLWGNKRGATQDFNALRTLLDHPSQHLWVTFEDGYLWWCTVNDRIEVGPAGESKDRGNFWLTCASQWSNRTIDGMRLLAMAELPGIVTAAAGFRGTICEPRASLEILRIVKNEENSDAQEAMLARRAYETAVAKLVARLGPKDFELLIELILSRSGWTRLATLGGVREGLDIEAENVASDEVAFVQVKSSADQSVLDQYLAKFLDRRERYSRMIFAVHSPKGTLKTPEYEPVRVWTGEWIARLVVRHGLGDWVASRL